MTTKRAYVERLVREARTEVLLTAWHLGLYTPPDRVVLDGKILPYFATTPGFERVLFVGVKAYNAKNRELFAGRSYTTIDPNPAFAAFGSSHHIVAGLEEVAGHCLPESLDVVIVNGVLGHGLDAPAKVEAAIAGCHSALRAAGELVLGVNEECAGRIDLSRVDAMRGFVPVIFPPLGVARHVVATPLRERSHTFLFYRKA